MGKEFDKMLATLRKNRGSKKPGRSLPRKAAEPHSAARQSERWQLRTHGLSVSGLGRWLDCRESFRLYYAEGWRSTRTSAAIDYGELWHWLIGRHYNGWARKTATSQVLALYDRNWRAANPEAVPRRLDDLQLSIAKAAAMWPVYLEQFEVPDRKRNWVGVEVEFEDVKIHGAGSPLDMIPWRGILDGMYRDKKKRLWLLETKTKGQIDEFAISDTMHLDPQVMIYLLVCRELYSEPAGILYNVIRNPASLPSKKKNEGLPEFSDRLEEMVRKDPDHYFKRWEMPIKSGELDAWRDQQLAPMALDVWNWANGAAPHYVNPRNLIGKFGRSDMFGPITDNNFMDVYRKPLKRKERER